MEMKVFPGTTFPSLPVTVQMTTVEPKEVGLLTWCLELVGG